MASQYSADNLVAANKFQLRTYARNLGILHDNSETLATLVTKIKAK